jgi:alkylation response protein AidB-like acyl-CoA dehydrogenase
VDLELEFSSDQLEMKDLVRQILVDICPSSLIREVAERQAGASSLWQKMGELSWPGLAIPAEFGGVGLGFVEVCLVAEELGRVAAPGPYMATVTQFAPMVRETGAVGLFEKLLSRVAEASIVGALAVSEANRWDLQRIDSTLRMADGRWILSGQKTAVLDGDSADELAIVARGARSSRDEGLCVVLVPRRQVVVRKRTIIDPTLELVDIDLNELTIDADRILLPPGVHNAAI